ncbi:MAG: polysaccharide deacetylase family protein [Patescibacteria group bacterium]|nr:polysaccharide deacetylase family protein [Patescibacteria group bacterium]
MKKKRREKLDLVDKIRIGVALFFILCSILVLEDLNKYSSEKLLRKVSASSESGNKIIASVTPVVTFTVSPTATPTVSPPIKYLGFCLEVPVLMYHHVEPSAIALEKGDSSFNVDSGVFEQHMAYLNSSGYKSISAKQLIDSLKNHTELPGKSVVITLDDGYRDVYEFAYPIAKKYHIILNLAIPTGLINGERYMNWDQIKEMSQSGIVNFIDHTWSHYSVNQGSFDKIKYEIETAKNQLEQYIGQKIDIFAYPYGSSDQQSINVLEQGGFIGAFSTIQGTTQCDSFIFNLHRTRVGNAPLSSYGL